MNSHSNRNDYPYDEAIDDIELFIKSHIKDPATYQELLTHLSECRKAKRLGFRYIHEKLMTYRKESSDYFPFSEDERKMIDNLFYFWS